MPYALTGITDENGVRFATYEYQADGMAVSTSHAGSANQYQFTRNSDGTSTVTDPLGTDRTHRFQTVLGVVKSAGVDQPGGAGCSAASSAITYDANGNVASRADFNGHKTCYAYDLTRNLETARVEGLDVGVSCPTDVAAYTPAVGTAERKILTQWDTTFRLPTKVTEAGRETSTVYDSHGNVTSRSVKDLATGQVRTWTTTYTYHATVPGVLVQKVEDGPRTDVSDLTTTDYYAPDATCVGGGTGCRGQVWKVTNALGHVTTFNSYDADGRLTQTTDPNGLVTSFTYTARGWLKTRTARTEVDSFDYDNVGQLKQHTRPDGTTVGYEYDDAHRLTDIVLGDGSRLHYTLDNAGNRTGEEIRDSAGTVTYTHTRNYDALGRLWQDIGAYNQTVTYGYDAQGNLKTEDGARTDVTDLTNHDYDTLDRLTQTLAADNGTTSWQYNARDDVTQVTDPAYQATTTAPDAFGGVTTTTSADTGVTSRTYDSAGNLKTETDARGITVTYSWDALNRLTQKVSSDPNTPRFGYGYDSCTKGKGRLCYTYLNNGIDLVYATYDAYGRVDSRIQFQGSGGLMLEYTYRPGGQIETMTYWPNGTVVTYDYDTLGRIRTVTAENGGSSPVTLVNPISYAPFGAPTYFTYGNGALMFTQYDLDYRPTLMRDGPWHKTYGYDPAGNVDSLTDYDLGGIVDYAYDATGRLNGATDPATWGALGWTYDGNGNRQSETRNASHLDYVYNPAGGNWLFQIGSDIRPKTANGNVASGSAIGTLSYDGYNRLVGTTNLQTVYTYNALGQRFKKTNQNGLTTTFQYGEQGQLLQEKTGSNTKEYIWMGDRLLARVDNGTSIYYYHVDRLGTPQAMTDAAQQVVWQADYEPFGKANVTVATVENNIRLPGQYYDNETGLHYNYFRDYDPGTGRYVEADPIGLGGGSNLYGYAGGNPLTYTDPAGLVAGVDDAIVIGGAIAVSACIATNCTKPIVDAMQSAANAISNILSESQGSSSAAANKKGVEQWNKQPPIQPGLYTCRYVMYFPEDQCKDGQCPPFVTGRGYSPMLTAAMAQARTEAQEKIPPRCGHQHHGQMWCRYGGNPPFMP